MTDSLKWPLYKYADDVKAKAEEIKAAITAGEYFAFTGPHQDTTGKLQLKDGEIADRAHPDSMSYYVEGIDAVHQINPKVIRSFLNKRVKHF